MNSVILKVDGPIPDIDGKLFQVHRVGNDMIRLYSVTLEHDDRCPVVIGYDRCAGKVGHEGKHYWAGGD